MRIKYSGKENPVRGTNDHDKIVGIANEVPIDGTLVEGLDGDDYIVGTNGGDILVGGVGNDSLSGHAGADTLVGGEGNDLFVFRSWNSSAQGHGIDTVADFEANDFLDFHYLFNAVNPDPDGFYQLVPLTMADVVITSSDATHHRVTVTQNFGGPVYVTEIDVVGVQPTETNIIF